MAATTDHADKAVYVEELRYDYGGEAKEDVLKGVTFDLDEGSRCLLVGINGTGKTTLLRLLAGRHMVKTPVLVLGKHSYFATPRGLTFLGSDWANNPVTHGDIAVTALVESMGGSNHPERLAMLIDILGVDMTWHLHRVSDGQRRRVQLLLGLLQPWKVLLLDEVTVDLDILVRRDLLAYLTRETEENGCTVVYATHIFDGLGDWATHIMHLSNGAVARFEALEDLEELKELSVTPAEGRSFGSSPLLLLIERWLRDELRIKKEAAAAQLEAISRGEIEDPASKQTPLEKRKHDVDNFGDRFYNYWN